MRLVALSLLLGCARRIPDPALPAPPPLPELVNPSPLSLCWLEFATGALPHHMVVAHGALREDVESTASGLLLQHPGGVWLIDGGMAADLKQELKELHGLPRLFIGQAAKGWTDVARPREALAAAGVGALDGMAPTHGHFDHLGGLLELDGVVTLPEAELDAARTGQPKNIFLPAEARALAPRAAPLAWDGGPFLYWDQSHDLYGDGSVILVPLPGHTPGSLGVLARPAEGPPVMLVGDTVWVREGFEARERKSWLASNFDADGDSNDLQIGRLAALHQAMPDLVILPAHDRRVWQARFGAPGCR